MVVKESISLRNAGLNHVDQTELSHNLVDREIDRTVRHFMMQSPPSRVYPALMQSIRGESKRSRNRQAAIVPAFGLVTAALLLVVAFGLAQQLAVRNDPAAPGRVILLLTQMSNTGLARWINESESVFGYPGILFLHTFGLAMVVGFSIAIDVRLLGVAPGIPAASLRRLFPYIWFGFWVNAVSGLLLFMAGGPRKAMNPLFEIKLALVALGVVAMSLIHRQLFRIEIQSEFKWEDTRKSKFLAYASLAIWFAAIAAGRLLAYVHGN